MTGIGKIVSGSKKQMTAKESANSRAPWITGQLESSKLSQTMGSVYSGLALTGSLASSYMKSYEPYKEMQAGGKEVGLDIPDLSVKDRIGMMFGKGADDMLTKNYESEGSDNFQYRDDDPLSVKQTHQYSGATLQDIGKRANTGTLQSFLEGESIGEKFGKDISEDKWWDAKMGQVDAHQPSEFSDSPWSAKDKQLVDSVGMDNFMSGQKREASRAAGSSYASDSQENYDSQMLSDRPDLAGTGGSDEYRALNPDDTTFYGNPQNKGQYAPFEKPAPMKQEPIYRNMQEADYGGEPTNIGGAADTSDLTDYASYDSGYRTSNAHASGYAGMGYDPNEGGQTSMEGAGAQGDPGSNGQPTDMSGNTLYGRENKRFTHTETPGYAGQAARTGLFYSDQELPSERELAKRDPMAGYESGYDQSWLKPGGSMYSTIGDSLR